MGSRVEEHGFEGRVAIVTGAGRGIGRAEAMLLAARGAGIVVNDLGAATDGSGTDDGPAAAVVAEIVAAGGEAVASGHDVSDPLGATALVDTAVARFGRLDVVVNNAGIVRYASLPDVDVANLDAHLAVHVRGSFLVLRAAWPHLVESGAGRVVNTTSAGVFGLPANLGYATAKAGLIGMTRSAALAGAADRIKVNLVAPAAMTRMAGRGDAADDPPDAAGSPMDPALVAPLVAFLAHEACPVSGEIYAAGAGRFARVLLAQAEGWVDPTGAPTVESVAAHWPEIDDPTRFTVPDGLVAWSRTFLAHLPST